MNLEDITSNQINHMKKGKIPYNPKHSDLKEAN